MTTHTLKIWPEFFNSLVDGSKTFEVRKDDREYRVGDRLILKEWETKGHFYTGREVYRHITYKMDGGNFGLEPGYCVLGIR